MCMLVMEVFHLQSSPLSQEVLVPIDDVATTSKANKVWFYSLSEARVEKLSALTIFTIHHSTLLNHHCAFEATTSVRIISV